MKESVTSIWVYFNALFTAFVGTFPTKSNTSCPIFVEVVTNFRNKFVSSYSGVTIILTEDTKTTTYISLCVCTNSKPESCY